MPTEGLQPALEKLIDAIALNKIDENLFVGESQNLFNGRIFGGQVIAQALSAAQQTVDEHLVLHSCQSYFLLAGDAFANVVYHVERLRDGKSFCTRRVTATQGGRPIFNLSASFQKVESGFEHSVPMPDAVDVDTVSSEAERWLEMGDMIPPQLKRRLDQGMPIELRVVDPNNPLKAERKEPHQGIWMRLASPIGDDLSMHQFLMAYASDFNFVGTALRPHGVTPFMPDMQIASLDHSIWFHRPFRFDEWLYYHMESPTASGARGFARGQIFTQSGELIASTAQEGLIRQWSKK